MNAANGAFVLVEAINKRPHPIVPQLDDSAVETGEDPWPLRVETQSLDTVALRLEFSQHRKPNQRSPQLSTLSNQNKKISKTDNSIKAKLEAKTLNNTRSKEKTQL